MVAARQGRRCRDRNPATGRDPGEWSRSGDESPETVDSATERESAEKALARSPAVDGG